MTETKEKEKAIIIPNAREKITKAILEFIKKSKKVEKEELFKVGIKALDLTKDQLKDKSSDSTNTRYKALTGTIIAELIQQGVLPLLEKKSKASILDQKQEELIKQKKESIKEYLYLKYLTDDEKIDRKPESKANIIKSILNDKKNKSLFDDITNDDIQNKIESQFRKIANIPDQDNNDNTPISNCLRNNKEKHSKLLKKEISEKNYNKSLDISIIEAINIAGGINFSRLSLELIKKILGNKNIIEDKVTDGGNDHGIDAELTLKDIFGFVEKIAIQAKTRQSDTSEIGEKVTREFIGSMLVAKADKGIFITNVKVHSEAKAIAKTVKNLLFIDKTELLHLIKKHKIGVIMENNALILDKDMFIIK